VVKGEDTKQIVPRLISTRFQLAC